MTQETATNPLAAFAPFIGGEWQMDGTCQTLEWGVGQKSVIARNYFPSEEGMQLVSEGFWYWHPSEKQIRGTFTAIHMPVELFDYVTRFEQNKMISNLRSYTPQGAEEIYIEEWELTGSDSYQWRLLAPTPEGPQQAMGGIYTRITNKENNHG